MVTLEEVDGLIRAKLRGKLPEDAEIGPDTQLKDLGLSSLQLSDIVFSLEEAHDVEFDASKAADVKTVGQMIDVANEALGASASDGAVAG